MKYKFFLWLARFSLEQLYNYIDKNNDGKIDKQELLNLSQTAIILSQKLKKRKNNQKNVRLGL